jgi:two-component system, LytTR family, response regulator
MRPAGRRSRADSGHWQSVCARGVRCLCHAPSCARNEETQWMKQLRLNAATPRAITVCRMTEVLGREAPLATGGMGRLRILVVDGDELARRRLRAMLRSVEPLADLDEAGSAPQAGRGLVAVRPDVVLLDMDLPGAAGIEALRRPDAPALLAMTAHPEVALAGGCDLEALDYLVKPLQRERLAAALRRARRRLAERHITALALEIAETAAAIEEPAGKGGSARPYPDQLTIRVRRRMFALPVADIVWIQGASQYSRVHARGGEYLQSRSLSSLEFELDPSRFFRIHRSAIVNATYVREVMSRGDGRYNVYLQGGQALPMGRARRDLLGKLLGSMRGATTQPSNEARDFTGIAT